MGDAESANNKVKVLVRVGASPASGDEAVRLAGQMLLSAGCVDADYIDGMRQRENSEDFYIEYGVAVIRGPDAARDLVRRDGIAAIQTPGGLEWVSGREARLVLCVAAGPESLEKILSRLDKIVINTELLHKLFDAADPVTIAHALDPNRPLDAAAPNPASGHAEPSSGPLGEKTKETSEEPPEGIFDESSGDGSAESTALPQTPYSPDLPELHVLRVLPDLLNPSESAADVLKSGPVSPEGEESDMEQNDLRESTSGVNGGPAGGQWIEPSESDIDMTGELYAGHPVLMPDDGDELSQPAETMDGAVIRVSAFADGPGLIADALKSGADGLGLLRTEFLFSDRTAPPDEDEQYEAYVAMLEAAAGRPCVIRALDAGALLAPSCLYIAHEDEPAMSLCGSRLLLKRRDVFEPQMRALYRAAADYDDVSVLFPMITSEEEAVELRELCGEIRSGLGVQDLPLGFAVEAPSAALMAPFIARHADFLCIGTDELFRFAMASDRPAGQLDALHPAVLRLVRLAAKGAEKRGIKAACYGALCGHAFGAAMLAGLGVEDIVAGPDDIQTVKAMLRSHTRERLATVARRCLDLANAEEVLEMAAELEDDEEAGE